MEDHIDRDPTADVVAAGRAAALIASAGALVIAAGAGMGIDSGLPDFRCNTGLWQAYPALAAAQPPFMAIASPTALRDDPRRAWGFYGHRLALYRDAVPHPGFAMLRNWGEACGTAPSFLLATSMDTSNKRVSIRCESMNAMGRSITYNASPHAGQRCGLPSGSCRISTRCGASCWGPCRAARTAEGWHGRTS
jgi:hypothetical protein